jgi:hypothetical protein
VAANPTAVWRVRPSGNNNNGAGYDAGIASAGTDFSQQNAAQVTQSGGTVSTATVTLTDTGASFTSALIGNGIRVAGTGITTTYTFITAVPTGTTLTLQTSPGTTGTSVTYSIGGGWADFWTNTSSSGPLVPGNTLYILGSGIPNPASYSYDYVMGSTASFAAGNGTDGLIRVLSDPGTPSYKAPPDTTGGMPLVDTNARNINSTGYCLVAGIWAVMTGGGQSFQSSANDSYFVGCVSDQLASGGISFYAGSNQPLYALGCEVFSSTGGSSGNAGILIGNTSCIIDSCNIHDTQGPCIELSANISVYIINSIFAKCNGYGILLPSAGPDNRSIIVIKNNTIDGNIGSAIRIQIQAVVGFSIINNNIISNHVTAATYGITVEAGTAAQNSRIAGFIDYNTFYNNSANYNAINAGAHDTALGVTPYVNSSTEDYTLA